jgi:hypothetical protein
MEREVDSVDMRSEREVREGEEVFNSYGRDIGDSRLLVEWGFLEGEFAGHGLEWSLAELLSNSGRGKQGSGKSIKEVWEDIVTRGGVALELYPDEDPDDDGQKLICPPITTSSSDPEHILNLNHNGQISLNIWIALYLRFHSLPTYSEELEAGIIKSVNALEMANISPNPTLDATSIATSRLVVNLLKGRSNGMYRPEVPMEALLDMRDVGPSKSSIGVCGSLFIGSSRRRREDGHDVEYR